MQDVCRKCGSMNLVSNFGRVIGFPGFRYTSSCVDCGTLLENEPAKDLTPDRAFIVGPRTFTTNPED